jgi:hypothetical protein
MRPRNGRRTLEARDLDELADEATALIDEKLLDLLAITIREP